MAILHVPYGVKGTLDLEIEDRHLALTAERSFPGEIPELDKAISEALDRPIAGDPFSARLARARRVAILVDNFARLTPAGKLLLPILKMAQAAGKQVEIIVASGALREMSETELRRKLGDEVLASGIPVVVSKARDKWDFEFVGVTSYGTPINIHKRVMRADLKIAVTMTQATLWGYGGGGSMILPGVCSFESIEWNHRLMTAPKCGVGYEPPANRMREDIEEALRMSCLDMSVLAILNPRLEVMEITVGETIAAHRASVQKYNAYYRTGVPEQMLDVAISGSFPGDRFFAHSCWPIANLDAFVRDDGTIVIATPAPGGLAHYSYAAEYMPPTPDNIRRLYDDMFYGKQELWHACLWMPIIQVLANKNCIVITEPERLADFATVQIPAVTSWAEAYRLLEQKYGPAMRVGYFPYGKWVIADRS